MDPMADASCVLPDPKEPKMKTRAITLAALAFCLQPLVARAGPADEQLNLNTQQYRSGEVRGQWVNTLMPRASADFVSSSPDGSASSATAPGSADTQMAIVLASYTRGVLDAGGWVNPYVSDQTYAVGNALLAVRIGEGLTSGPSVASLAVRALIARAGE
jgi:hypothetical protein